MKASSISRTYLSMQTFALVLCSMVFLPNVNQAHPSSAGRTDHSASSRGGLEVAGIHINGRFDLAFELVHFAPGETAELEYQFQNYHRFLFLSRAKEDEPFWLNAEIVGQTFFEFGIKLSDRHRLRFGKVLVPFGSDPLFHSCYGGRCAFDQRLLPTVWSELGAVYDANLYQSNRFSIDNELYLVSGISGQADKVLELNRPGNPKKIAVGNRLRIGYYRYTLGLSVYCNQYTDDHMLLMYGVDIAAAPGFLPIPFLDRLGLAVGTMFAEVDSDTLGDYYHFGSYLQLDLRLPWSIGLRYRAGAVTVNNQQGLFYDDRPEQKTADDTLAHNFTLYKRIQMFTVSLQYLINIEAVDETNNDLFRVTLAMDF